MKNSLNLGKIFGIRVSIHWTFVLLLGWVFISQYRIEGYLDQAFDSVLQLLTLFSCVVLHEFGHAIMAKEYGIKTESITLLPIGGVAEMEQLPEKPLHEMLVSFAGPIVNLFIAGIISISLFIFHDSEVTFRFNELQNLSFWENILIANIILALFNLIPAFPLDGGRILRAALSLKFNRAKATLIAARIGQFLSIGLAVIGVLFNFWLILIAFFIFFTANTEAKFEQNKLSLNNTLASELMMTNFSILSPKDNLEYATNLLLNSQELYFPVLLDGKVKGVVSRPSLLSGLEKFPKTEFVTRIMSERFMLVKPTTSAEHIFAKFMSGSIDLAIITQDNICVGLIDNTNLNEFLTLSQINVPKDSFKKDKIFPKINFSSQT